MPERTRRASVIAKALVDQYKTDMAGTNTFGLNDVFYGDQVKIPKSPTLCIEPAQTVRIVNSTGCQTENDFALNVILYDSRLGDVEGIQFDLDTLAEDIMDDLNKVGTLGDLIVFGHALTIEYGYLIKSNRLMRADRIVFTAKTKTELTDA